MNQRGFLSPMLIGGIVIATSIALLGVQTWRLGRAQAAVGALEQRAAQLEADVEAQAATLAEERREREQVDALLATLAADKAKSDRRVSQLDARYRNAIRDSQQASTWADTHQPDPALERVCSDEAGHHAGGEGAGPAAFCAARGLPVSAATGADKR